MHWTGIALGAAASSALALASCTTTRPPLPEAVIVVGTNVAVPGAVSRLRIDLYAEDGRWFESRDVALPDPRDWPTSFGVFSDDESRERAVWVRLRGYPEGRIRDYRGERPLDWSAPFVLAPGDEEPRLVRDGADLTPRFEPDPLLTIDRLVRVRLRPGVSAVANVTLHGACLGTMPTLATLASGAAEGCVDQEKTRGAVTEVAARDEGPAQTGTWLAVPCGQPAGEDRVCVVGGATTVGASDQAIIAGAASYKPSVPVRAFGVTSFWMDRTEVTVARVRAALAAGYAAAPPRANDGPIVTPSGIDDVRACTYSSTPRGREDYAVTCWTWREARAFCQHEGGDLPTEVQWEHAATMAARERRTRYPWGNEEATCARAAVERAVPGGSSRCSKEPRGPDGVYAHPDDVTPFGALGMGGGVSEWVRDRFADFSAPCWRDATIVDPSCDGPGGFSWRGSAWITPLWWSTYRTGVADDASLMFVGFRCVYPVKS